MKLSTATNNFTGIQEENFPNFKTIKITWPILIFHSETYKPKRHILFNTLNQYIYTNKREM